MGTEYTVDKNNRELLETNSDGECRSYSRKISVRPLECMLEDAEKIEEKKKRYEEVLRHEVVHAYFTESGIDEYSQNEQLVDWIARQMPKINKTMEEILDE